MITLADKIERLQKSINKLEEEMYDLSRKGKPYGDLTRKRKLKLALLRTLEKKK